MSGAIETAKVIEFSGAVHVAAQQMTNRTKPYVQIKMIKGEDYAYDGIGELEAVEITSRLQRTQGQSLDVTRRKIHMREFRATLLLDKKDQLEVMFDPKNNYAQAVARAMYKKFDRVALSAAFEDVRTGKDFSVVLTAAQDGVITVNATGGFTYEKSQEIMANFEGNEVGTEMDETIMLAISEQEKLDLMNETEVINNQFVTMGTFNGSTKLKQVSDMDVVRFGSRAKVPMLRVNGSTRDCVAASSRGICMGISEDLSVEVNTRSDLNNATQVQASMFMGAVRTEGKLVQKVQTTVKA